MTAHQPNFFGYSGVFRKATLAFVLAKKLEKTLGVPVVNFFGIADQDFTDDRWVKSCQLPAIQRRGGILSIDVKLPEKLRLNSVAKPSPELLLRWKSEIEEWLNGTIRSIDRLCKEQGFAELSLVPSIAPLHENFEHFWNIVEDCHDLSDNFSDFNAFVISKIVNDVWGYDTVFARFSECQRAFVDEFAFLVNHFDDYSRSLKEVKQMTYDEGMSGPVSEQEPFLVPFWYQCDCGSKVKLFMREKNGSLFGEGNCVSCSESHKLELGAKNDLDNVHIAPRISARAIPMVLIFFSGLKPSCYVGGIAGTGYLMQAKHAADAVGILFPPIAIWRPHDKYLGVGQTEALLELKRICSDLDARNHSTAKKMLEFRINEVRKRLGSLEVSKKRIIEKLKDHPDDSELKAEIRRISITQTNFRMSSNLSVVVHELKILENVSTVLDLVPSIIDYAVNVGLKETSDQWIRHLSENGSLSSDVHMESVLNENVRLDTV
jgi:hypothetical protein